MRVPGDRLIGNDGDGWALAMYLLQWERGMYPWQRQAGLLGTLDALLERAGDAIDPHTLADAFLAVLPMRLSSSHTIRRLAAGETPGPEVSVDKVLLARRGLAVFDLVDTVLKTARSSSTTTSGRGNGATITCSVARRPSTAAPTRSSARSWPTVCSGCPVGDVTAVDREALDAFERTARGVLAQPEVDVADALEQIGWRDFLDADAPLGRATGVRAARRAPPLEPALDDVAFVALGTAGEELRAAGHAFAHPRGSAPAATSTATGYHIEAFVMGGRLDVPVALVADDGVVSVAAAALEWTPVVGIDPTLGLVRVRGAVDADEAVVRADVDAGAVAHACRRALAHELLGATDSMLVLATEYAKVREQFGQPIGAFQAVKHRLADVYVARQAAAAVIGESWWSDPECTTLAAKALAATAGAAASEHCLQVLGAIGFTLEHDLHRFVRRVRVLDRLYGSDRELRTALGLLLQARGRVPRPGGT